MTREHLPQEQLELYVLDMLDGVDKADVERHVAGCARCASALAAEARAELDLQALVAGVKHLAERGERQIDAAPRARRRDQRAGEHRWSRAARMSMGGAALVVLVWSLGSARLDSRHYVPSRVPPGAELISSLPSSSSEPWSSGEVEVEEPLCPVSTAAAPVEPEPSSDIEGPLESCAEPVTNLCRSEESGL
jgi:anti-sigma factor RsiW